MEMNWTIIGAWFSAGLTLFILSFLYRDNPLFKLAEHLYIGISVGYSITLMLFNVWLPRVFYPVMALNFEPIIPSIIGLSILLRIHPKHAWVSRFGFAFIMGYGSGIAIPAVITTSFLKQVEGTIRPLFVSADVTTWLSVFSGLVVAIGVVTVLFYFFFSVEHKGALKYVPVVGIYFLMVYLGASFGATVMARFALLYGRMFDLTTYSSSFYNYATPILAVFVIIFLVIYTKMLSKRMAAEAAAEEN